MGRITQALRGLLTSREYRELFFYRRWASERHPYKSQHGQDWQVDRLTKKKENGYFLDLAAADGTWISNTWFFENYRGWNGICIEPNPEMFTRLSRDRTAICVNQCISDKPEMVQFRVDRGVTGGIVAEDTDNQPESGGTLIEIEAVTLTDLLRDLDAPAYIDYFSLDVEGAEDRVIRGLDLSVYKFGFLTIERPSEFVTSELRSHGYKAVKKIGEDVLFSSTE